VSGRAAPHRPNWLALLLGLAGIGVLTAVFAVGLHVRNPTIVALAFLLIVLIVAAISTRVVAIAVSLLAFLCFNYFFLPPVGTWTIADPENWVALFTLLAVSLIASHLSALARRRAEEATARGDELARVLVERTQLLEERKEAELVRRSAELKSALLASLGHDLRTPLTALMVAANNLDASWLTGDQRHEQAAIVRTELDRLNRLLNNIVEMARIETNAVDAEPEWVSPLEIVQAAARHAEQALARHQLKIDDTADKMLVRLDPRLTSAALAHVLENAGQYSPPGTTITVTVSIDGEELRMTVRDEGVGIAPGDFDRLFDRSYRGVDARQQRFGSGMGLAITRGLLAAEGGRVWAEPDRPRGAVFTIAVPVESHAAAVEADSL
jgi:two-component system sensor histidine kinase KdpD